MHLRGQRIYTSAGGSTAIILILRLNVLRKVPVVVLGLFEQRNGLLATRADELVHDGLRLRMVLLHRYARWCVTFCSAAFLALQVSVKKDSKHEVGTVVLLLYVAHA